MITDYEIRGIKGEETLYLYLEFSSEFAKLKSGEKRKKLREIVEEFLKEKNIEFDGKKIAIISGGMLMATLVLGAPKFGYTGINTIGNDYEYQNSVVLADEELDFPSAITVEPKKEENKQNVNDKKEISTESKNVSSKGNATSSTEKQSSQSKPTTSTKPANPPVSTNNAGNATTSSIPKEETKSQEVAPVESGTFVTVKRSNGQVLKLELEEYVIGVVGAEMPAAFDTEALKAQAVIARTYALKAIERGSVLTDTSSTQNYKSVDQLKALWGSGFNTYYNKVKSAATSTKGMCLIYNGSLIDAVYHSTSNGHTEDAKYVWGNAFPYLVSVDSPYDSSNKSFIHTMSFSYETLSSKLGAVVTSETPIDILSRTSGERVYNVSFGGTVFTGIEVRSKLGLRSADFDIEQTASGVTFTTRGFGHGVGLSQYGANGMAKAGYNYESILKHYYRGVSLVKR